MLNKKHSLKSGNNKDMNKGFGWWNSTGNQKRERIDEENLVIFYFDVALFMKQKQRRKEKKETKIRNQKKAQKKDKKEERKEQDRETEQEKVKKGEAKKGKG